jgi:hypothetical protein
MMDVLYDRQKIGAFKIRGAMNAVAQIPDADKSKGVGKSCIPHIYIYILHKQTTHTKHKPGLTIDSWVSLISDLFLISHPLLGKPRSSHRSRRSRIQHPRPHHHAPQCTGTETRRGSRVRSQRDFV